MPTIDLDAAARSRAEQQHDQPTPNVVFRGKSFDLPWELPFGVFLLLGEAQDNPKESMEALAALSRSLFGDRSTEFLALGPSLDDMLALVNALVESYEFGDLPNPQGLPSSHDATGQPLKPTSSETTASTSAVQSGGTDSAPDAS